MTTEPATAETTDDEAIGQTFEDRYEILGELGRGGFGIVYKARQRTTGQLCAIKTLLLEKTDDDEAADRLLKRLEREMALIGRLDSPHIVRLYDSGVTPVGNPFLTLELAAGVTLRRLIKGGPLAPEPALRIMNQMVEALANAHEKGVIHRDLKPENIMVSIRNKRVNVKVLDFGIASLAEHTVAAGANLTLDKEVLGTPCYMPPEQIRSSSDALPQSDVYALGLIFAEMLTGKKAVTGATVHMILARQLVTPVELPEDLQNSPIAAFITRASSKEEGERYKDAAEMLHVLETIDHKFVPAQPGAQDFDALIEIEQTEHSKQEASLEESMAGTVGFSLAGISVIARSPAELAAEKRGRALVLLALLLVLLAVGLVVFLSLNKENAAAASAANTNAADSVPLSDDELGVDALLAKARTAKREGRTDEAIALYQKAVDKDPARLDTREELGYTFLANDKFESAKEQFAVIVDSENASENGVLGFGLAQAGSGDTEGARQTFASFVEKFPESERRGEVESRLDELTPPLDEPGPSSVPIEGIGAALKGGMGGAASSASDALKAPPERKRDRSSDKPNDDENATDDGEDKEKTEVKRIGIFE